MSSLFKRQTRTLIGAVCVLSLTACNFFGGAIIGGNITGLTSGNSVVLQNNSELLTVTANGKFTFLTGVDSGQTYSVSVATQPSGQTCAVSSGSGTVNDAGDDVTSVAVTCAPSASLGGTVTGMVAGTALVLTNSGVNVTVVADGSFSFPGILTAGTAYAVTITQQPAGQTCTLANATGTIVANQTSQVTVTCN